MLGLMIAAGVINVQTEVPMGAIVATAECTVAAMRRQPETSSGVGMPLGAPVWQQAFDPGDHVPYAIDFSDLLTDGEKIAGVDSIRLTSTAAALGVTVDQAAQFAPLIDSASQSKVQLWLFVAVETQNVAQFDDAGTRVGVQIGVRTDATPPRRFERTGVLIVRQQ